VASLDDISKSDCIVVVGGDPLEHQKVLGYVTRRAADGGANLIVVNDKETGLTALATARHPLRSTAKVKAAVEKAERPVVIYSGGLKDSVYEALRGLPTKTRFLPLVEGANAVGAAKAGLSARAVGGDALFIFAGDEKLDGARMPKAGFVAAMAAYEGKWLKGVDVVLPAQVWTEKSGHVTNMEGREIAVVPFITPPDGIPAAEATLAKLQKEIG
jgi:predicted molibdopterin-dependent oxidoreductase YjgC